MIQSENSNTLPVDADQGKNVSGTISNVDVWLTPSDSPDVLGSVYFVRAGDFIKIGFATKMTPRMSGLQTSCPMDIVLLGSFMGTMSDEQDIHMMFADLHVRGEWFKNHSRILSYLDERDPKKNPRQHFRPETAFEGMIKRRRIAALERLNAHSEGDYELGYNIGYCDALAQLLDHMRSEDN